MTSKLVIMTIILGGSKMSDFIENNGNRKEEILERSRNTIRDEGLVNAHYRGLNIGMLITTLAIGAPLVVICFITLQSTALNAILTINSIFLTVRNIFLYRFTRKKIFLISAIILGITGVSTFVMFILKAFGLI